MTNFTRIATAVCALAAAGAVAGETTREIPRPAKPAWIEASIDAVQKNGVAEKISRRYGETGADGRRALPIKHVVACASKAACDDVARWARQAGLEPAAVRTELGHGSLPYWVLDLRQRLPLETEAIHEAALSVHEALGRFADTRYETWMLDLDPEGVRDAR